MFGILIAAAYAAWNYAIGHETIEAAFLASMNFLWLWQIVLTGITALFVVLTLLGVTAGTTAAGASHSALGGLLGFIGGGAISAVFMAGFLLSRAILLAGTYLLAHAGTATMTFSQFDQTKLIGGGVLLVIGLLMIRSTSRTSSSSTAEA